MWRNIVINHLKSVSDNLHDAKVALKESVPFVQMGSVSELNMMLLIVAFISDGLWWLK